MGLGGMKPTRVVLQLADRSVKYPRGIVEDVLVQVDKFYFPVDFIILDTQPVSNLSDEIPVILGRPFLATCDANISCRSGMMTISFGNMTLDLNIFSISKQPLENDEVGEVNLIDNLVTDTFHQSSIKDPLEACLVHFGADFDFDKSIKEVNALLDSVPLIDSANWKSKVEPLPLSSSPPIPSIVKPPKLDLKQLPDTLKYAFLGPFESLPVIIASDLSSTQEEKLLQILREHKEAIGWSIADIKGISPSVVMHKIHLEDNAKTSREAQRRLNPAMKEVVRAEVLKLLDVGVIYPISDSQWVSPVQVVPKKSGITVVKNDDNELVPTRIQTGWRVCIDYLYLPKTLHLSLYTDGWFQGISWNSDETLIAYVAEEPSPSKPTFTFQGYKKGSSTDKEFGNWKGQGEWEEEWGETYAGKRQPALFVINVNSGETQAVKGIEKRLSVGQVVWAPPISGSHQYLVFVGWSADTRKLGMVYCYNRPCALYAVKAPLYGSEADGQEIKDNSTEDCPVVNLTQSISSAFFPRFSPDGKLLLFLSARSSVDSGAHSATDSLHKFDWPVDGVPCSSMEVVDVIPVVMCADDGCFPGLYCSSFLTNPWLSDGCTMIMSSFWGSCQVILSVNVLSGEVSRISPTDSNSWNVLSLDGDNIVTVSSSPVHVPHIKYGFLDKESKSTAWNWLDVPSPTNECSGKVKSLLSSLQFSIMKIPVKDVSDSLTKGARKPFEAIFVSSKAKRTDPIDPLIVILHGGPHSVYLTSFSKNLAFLSSIGFNLLLVNYRGSVGFGEEALQSLPGKVGSQDVNDVLVAIDHVIDLGLASPSKIAVLGGSHGGFLTTHLIGQAPEKFAAACARNPVCNLALMVGTTDIPDWCYVEAYGSEGKNIYSEAPSAEDLALFHSKSPISHILKVKTPTLFLLGAQDLRVPISTGLQYARALKDKGVAVKVIMFPNDIHPIDRPQSDFESFLNIGVWFKKYLF
ncbi:PREDICTED: acylamino-acid-releasing enzyme-like [Fragaria vesca subsp. vesca]